MFEPAEPREDLTGQCFGTWTTIGLAGRKNKRIYWLCRCGCGAEQPVESHSLKNGRAKRCKACRGKRNGEHHTTHGLTKTVEYRTWQSMKTRCYNPKSKWFEYWGGRGITVHPDWLHDFPAFLEHVGPKPSAGYTIDRIDNDKNYEPGNVRWATQHEQMKNRRSWKKSLA